MFSKMTTVLVFAMVSLRRLAIRLLRPMFVSVLHCTPGLFADSVVYQGRDVEVKASFSLARSQCRCELAWLRYHSAGNAATRYQYVATRFQQRPARSSASLPSSTTPLVIRALVTSNIWGPTHQRTLTLRSILPGLAYTIMHVTRQYRFLHVDSYPLDSWLAPGKCGALSQLATNAASHSAE